MGPLSGCDVARDFFVATTDRRSELRGLKWDIPGRGGDPGPGDSPKTPRGVPQGFGTFTGDEREFEPFAAKAYHLPRRSVSELASTPKLRLVPPREKLALILRYSMMPLRWEPLNFLSQHRGVASAAAAFPIDTYVIQSRSGHALILRASPLDFALLDERTPLPCRELGSPDDLTLVLVGCHGVCAQAYGELSPCLLALEAGMISSQISLLAALLGWQASVVPAKDWQPYREALGLNHWSDMPILLVKLAGEGVSSAVSSLEASQIRTLKPLARHEFADDFPRMRALIDRASQPLCLTASETGPDGAGAANRATAAFLDWAADRDLLAALASRSSGLSMSFVGWPDAWDRGMLDSLLSDIAVVNGAAQAAQGISIPLFLSLCARTAKRGTIHAYGVELPACLLQASPASRAHELAGNFPSDSFCVFTIGADDVVALDRYGAFGFIAAHVAAGSLAQSICIAAALHGLTARPLRSYADSNASALLPLEARALLQIQIEYPKRANVGYRLF